MLLLRLPAVVVVSIVVNVMIVSHPGGYSARLAIKKKIKIMMFLLIIILMTIDITAKRA